MSLLRTGAAWPIAQMNSIGRGSVRVPAGSRWTHVQFRRFAGCPICSLHLRTFVRRKPELDQSGITEVVVFASSPSSLEPYAKQLPFDVIADPTRKHYRAAGVERSPWALVHPATWLAGLRGLVAFGASMPERIGDAYATPADFLIDEHGVVRACNYGHHADDQWTFDELLALARQAR